MLSKEPISKIAIGDAVDELPPEADDDQYELIAQFRAYIRSGRLSIGHGDLMLTIGIPYEDKYKALPISDLRGVTFVMGVYRPIRHDRTQDVIDINDINWISGDIDAG